MISGVGPKSSISTMGTVTLPSVCSPSPPGENLSFGIESSTVGQLSVSALIAQYVMGPPLIFGTISGLRGVHP